MNKQISRICRLIKCHSGVLYPLSLALLALGTTSAATLLRPETVSAWERYVQAVRSRSEEHLRSGRSFLLIDELQGVTNRVRDGELFVSPVGQTPRKVPAGLIHDWAGAAFIPDAKLDDVLRTVRDYDAYKQFYGPIVIDSRMLVRDAAKVHRPLAAAPYTQEFGGSGCGPLCASSSIDRFSVLLANKSIIAKTALDSDYQSSYFRVDGHRWYSISETTRIQEIENYGAPGQRMLSENEGTGLIWRLFSITRFEERDGGVYIEVEALALSRDVPLALRWIVTPMVRHVSKASLTTSLQQTGNAVRSHNILARETPNAERAPGPRTGNAALNTFHSFH